MITLISCLIIFICTLPFIVSFSKKISYDGKQDPVLTILCMALSIIFCFILFSTAVPFTGGICKDYGVVQQSGYVVGLDYKGIICKTYEVTLQTGVGEQVAVDKHFKASTTDKRVVSKLKSFLGKKIRVRLEANKWWILPYWLGATNNEITDVVPINNDIHHNTDTDFDFWRYYEKTI